MDRARLESSAEFSEAVEWDRLFDGDKLTPRGIEINNEIRESIQLAVAGVLKKNGLLAEHEEALPNDRFEQQTVKPTGS